MMRSPLSAHTARISNPYMSINVRIEYTTLAGELVYSDWMSQQKAISLLQKEFTSVRIEVWRGEYRVRWVRTTAVRAWVQTIKSGRQGFPRLDQIGGQPAFNWLSEAA